MTECKDCTCEMKYINYIKSTKNILCKRNNTNYKFILSLEFMFYISPFLFGYYQFNKNTKLCSYK